MTSKNDGNDTLIDCGVLVEENGGGNPFDLVLHVEFFCLIGVDLRNDETPSGFSHFFFN